MPGGVPLRCGRIGDLLTPAARAGPAFRRASSTRGCDGARRRGPRVALRAGGDGAGESEAAGDGSGGSLFDSNPQFSSVFKSVLARQGKSDSDSDGEAGSDGRSRSPQAPKPERKQSAVEEVLQAALAQSNSNLRRLDELRQQLEAATQAEEVQYDRIEFALQRTTMDAAYIATLNELRLDDQQKLFDFELEIQRLLEELHGPGQAPPASFEQPVSYGDGSVQPGLGGWGPPEDPPPDQHSHAWDGPQQQQQHEQEQLEQPGYSWDQPQEDEPEQQEQPEQPGYAWDSAQQDEPEQRGSEQASYSWDGPQQDSQQEEQPGYSWGSREAAEPAYGRAEERGGASGRGFSWDAPADSQEPEASPEYEPEPVAQPARGGNGYSKPARGPVRTFAWDEPAEDGGSGSGSGSDSGEAAGSEAWRREPSPERSRSPQRGQSPQRDRSPQRQAAEAYQGGATYSWRGQPAAEPQYSWRASGGKPSQPGFRWDADDEESDGEGYCSGPDERGYDI